MIVVIGDKALTYGGIARPAMQGETGGIEKMLPIGESSWYALFAGSPSVAEEVVGRVEDAIDADSSIPNFYNQMMDSTKEAYQAAREQAGRRPDTSTQSADQGKLHFSG